MRKLWNTWRAEDIGWIGRLSLLPWPRQFNWDHENKILTVYKLRGGNAYILEQEPVEYGDMRNHQIGRWHRWGW